MKAILIARVSTEEQKEAGNSLTAQISRLEQYCRNRGFTVLRTCSFDESAYTNSQSSLLRATSGCRRPTMTSLIKKLLFAAIK